MELSPRRFTVHNHQVSSTTPSQIACAASTNLSTALNRIHGHGLAGFTSHLLRLGFIGSRSDPSLFIYSRNKDTVYLLVYVDDIVLTASSEQLLRQTITALDHEFSLKDLGTLHYFLGVAIARSSDSMFLSQRQYILDIIERAV
jgi:hypothetical protein